MLVAKLGMVLSLEMVMPLGTTDKESAEKDLAEAGGQSELHKELFEHFKKKAGDDIKVELVDSSMTLVEI